MAIDLKPPATVAAQAKLGLELRRQQPPSRRGGTAVGVARARDLAARRTLSPDTIRRMRSYFARHSVDIGKPGWKDKKRPSKGWQAWLLWGGDPGRDWANAKWEQLQKERNKATDTQSTPNPPDYAIAIRAMTAREKRRRRMWRAWIRDVQGPTERMFARSIAAYLKGQAKRVSEALGEVAARSTSAEVTKELFLGLFDIDEIVNLAAEAIRMSEEIGRDLFTQAVMRGWAYGAEALQNVTIAWDPALNPAPRFFGQMVVMVSQTTKDNVEGIITQGLREGKTVAEMQLDLMRAEAFSPVRALRIARTESIRGLNAGSLLATKQAFDAGSDVSYEWLSARDRATRPSHLALDGKRVAPGEFFVVTIGENYGARAPCPGQFGIPSEDINCRCSGSPVVKGWEDDD